jgi:predicted Ser/Thr protein kinase
LRALYRDIVVFRESLLGSGATGLVFRGMYQGREVAIKVL